MVDLYEQRKKEEDERRKRNADLIAAAAYVDAVASIDYGTNTPDTSCQVDSTSSTDSSCF